MTVQVALRLSVSFCLFFFYCWVFWLVLNPVVSDEYRSYFINRETIDWRPKHYPATLEDGFTFSRPGIPEFVAFTTGLSVVEDWGRWSDAVLSPTVRVTMREPLLGDVCLVIKAHTTPKQVGRDIWVRMGGVTQSWLPETEAVRTYQFDFILPEPVSIIEVEPTAPGYPADWDQGNTDLRKLGIGFHHLAVLKGNCAKKLINEEVKK